MIKTKSSFLILLFNLKLEHIVNPWRISVDIEKESIIVAKRNWYLIGVNETTIAFRYIRKITIKQYLFGADVKIDTLGASISARYLPKLKVKKIRDALFDYNQNKGRTKFMIV